MTVKCADCGRLFDEEEIAVWQEDRGECWGQRAYETLSGCPYCFGLCVEKYNGEEGDEDDSGAD